MFLERLKSKCTCRLTTIFKITLFSIVVFALTQISISKVKVRERHVIKNWSYGEYLSVDLVAYFIRHVDKTKKSLAVVEPEFFFDLYLNKLNSKNFQDVFSKYSREKVVTILSLNEHVFNKNYEYVKNGVRRISCEENKDDPSHLFCLSNRRLFHVIFLKRKHDYFWFPKLQKIPEKFEHFLTYDDLMIGHHDSAFDNFTIGKKNGLPTVEDFLYFLVQVPASRFLECDKLKVEEFFNKHPQPEREYEVESNMKQAIISMKKMMRRYNVLFWASDGTLLGWYRQCGIIHKTGDVDFSIFADDFRTEMLESFDSEGIGILGDTLGQPLTGFEMRTPILDLFLVYDRSNSYVGYTFNFEPPVMYSLTYPKYTLCSAELLQTKIIVPCETEMVVKTEYGDNWMNPTEDYVVTNLRTAEVYDETYWKKYMYRNRDQVFQGLIHNRINPED